MREFGMMMMRDEELMSEEAEGMMKPAWLEGLMSETFFAACSVHENRRKHEKNIFCLGCCQSFCPHCLPSHRSHPLLQVRRYVYQDVIRLDDLEKLIDCSYIQPYTINSAKVIFLNQRAQSRSGKNSGNACFTCDRILQEPFNFCSLSCKVDYMVYNGENLSSILYRYEVSEFSYSQFERLNMDGNEPEPEPELFDDGQITPNSILEDPMMEYRNSNTTNNYNNNGMGNSGISSRQPEMGKKKKKGGNGGGFLPGIMLSLSSRRKGAPHRSPLS